MYRNVLYCLLLNTLDVYFVSQTYHSKDLSLFDVQPNKLELSRFASKCAENPSLVKLFAMCFHQVPPVYKMFQLWDMFGSLQIVAICFFTWYFFVVFKVGPRNHRHKHWHVPWTYFCYMFTLQSLVVASDSTLFLSWLGTQLLTP